MLTLSKILFSKLNENQIEYCHWKSNRNLHKALNGEEDLDVLLFCFESVKGSKFC